MRRKLIHLKVCIYTKGYIFEVQGRYLKQGEPVVLHVIIKGITAALLMTVLAVTLVQPVHATTSSLRFQSEQKFIPPIATGGENYGNSVAIDGDWMLIGSPHQDDSVANAGVAYVYQRQADDTWLFYQRLVGADFSGYVSQSGSSFGDAVAMSGEVIVIGAPGHNGSVDPIADSGLAFVYVLNTSCSTSCWNPLQVLDAGNERNTGDRFGDAVAIDASTIAVGAPLDEGVTANQGAVYVFQGSGASLNLVMRVRSNTAAPGGGYDDHFGNSVAVSGEFLVVGAYGIPELDLRT